QAEDGIRYWSVTGVQTCALPILQSVHCSLLRVARCGEEFNEGVALAAVCRLHRNSIVANGKHSCCGRSTNLPYQACPMLLFVNRSEERRVGKEGRSGWSAW